MFRLLDNQGLCKEHCSLQNWPAEVLAFLGRWQVLTLCCVMAVVSPLQTAGVVADLLCNQNSFPCGTESADAGMDGVENVDSLHKQLWHYSQKRKNYSSHLCLTLFSMATERLVGIFLSKCMLSPLYEKELKPF